MKIAPWISGKSAFGSALAFTQSLSSPRYHSAMGRFIINHCRKLQLGLSEFLVHVLSGEIRKGETFSCRGAYEHSKFRVQNVLQSSSHVTLVCAGSVAFDDEFAGITLDTDAVRLPSPSPSIPANLPTATPEEERTLEKVID